MLIYLIFIALALVALYVFFVSDKFSPVPYFPSNRRDMANILKMLALRNGQTVIDLGAGDGIVIFEAAKEAMRRKLNTKFVAVEINPILILILQVRRLLSPNKERIKIIRANMFKLDYADFFSQNAGKATYFIYISPWHIMEVLRRIMKRSGSFELVTYFYDLPKKTGLKRKAKLKGLNSVYKYIYV